MKKKTPSQPLANDKDVKIKIRYRKRPVRVCLQSYRRRANGLLNITLKTVYL